MQVDYEPLVMINFPLLKHFLVSFDYEYNGFVGLINFKGSMKLEASDVFALTALTLDATEKGHFYP